MRLLILFDNLLKYCSSKWYFENRTLTLEVSLRATAKKQRENEKYKNIYFLNNKLIDDVELQ